MLSLSILLSAVLVLSCGQNHRLNRIIEVDDRYTHMTLVGVSNDDDVCIHDNAGHFGMRLWQ